MTRDDLREALTFLQPAARQELLRVLKSPSLVRTDLIGKLYVREESRHVAEMLMDLESDDFARAAVLEALQEM